MKTNRYPRVTVLLLICLLCVSLIGCTGSAPRAEDVYDEVVALIEASLELNDVMFGQGLPVWSFDSDFAVEHHLYHDSDDAYYQYVTDTSPYRSIPQLQEAILAVYSEDYAAELFETLFDGFAVGTAIVRPQYIEQNGYLMQRTDYEPILTQRRLFDFSTLRVVRPSDQNHLTVEIDSYLEGESERETDRLYLVREANGWRLDTPTY